jgi:hypothetical protein
MIHRSNKYVIHDCNEFIQVPTKLMTEYKLDLNAIFLYSILRNEMQTNNEKEFLLLNNQEFLANLLRVNIPTLMKTFESLEENKLIQRKKQGQGEADKIYVETLYQQDKVEDETLNRKVFEEGIKKILIAFKSVEFKMTQGRKDLWYERLQDIPNNLYTELIERVIVTLNHAPMLSDIFKARVTRDELVKGLEKLSTEFDIEFTKEEKESFFYNSRHFTNKRYQMFIKILLTLTYSSKEDAKETILRA